MAVLDDVAAVVSHLIEQQIDLLCVAVPKRYLDRYGQVWLLCVCEAFYT
jgi:hypothetical protein